MEVGAKLIKAFHIAFNGTIELQDNEEAFYKKPPASDSQPDDELIWELKAGEKCWFLTQIKRSTKKGLATLTFINLGAPTAAKTNKN